MMSMDSVYLRVPAKPEYMLVIRLTTSAVASRAGFDVDEIEDIKLAVSEAGTFMMNHDKGVEWLELEFKVDKEEGIWIDIFASEAAHKDVLFSNNEQSELSFYIMESLMDGVEKAIDNGFLRGIKMYKKFGG
jgi:serine/threonine-protein kinase RsbW